MSWRNLSILKSARGEPIRDRIAVQKWAVVIRLGRRTLSKVGWKIGNTVAVEIGSEEHFGLIRIVRSDRGWSLITPGGQQNEVDLMLKLGRRMAEQHFPMLPDFYSSTIIDVAVRDGALEFRVPWIDASQPAKTSASPPAVDFSAHNLTFRKDGKRLDRPATHVARSANS